ncbi:hypothetical protein GCM10009792_18200 [Microcella alkalica]|uniref:AcrR family transcriptional regulator n=1 Tax=Microcella alkalica TaxID=355930 RepID=A0A839EE74_9MICO|nr:TetR family transcriptional regulator C-terminal domain-containing protein [Microcella alkalica]MBA8848712.1 AcrR family transcriptional regulator [Microcella alkalica]
MPRPVDSDQRLADIADATVRVARENGAQAVTVRSVARALGGSTTLVTNYLPTRSALIMNALDRARDRWKTEREGAARNADSTPLEAMLDAVLTSNADDPALRTLILEIVADATLDPQLRDRMRRESEDFQVELADAATRSGHRNPQLVADILYLALRGSIIASAEDPALWGEARLRSILLEAVDALPHDGPSPKTHRPSR